MSVRELSDLRRAELVAAIGAFEQLHMVCLTLTSDSI
jgi:hypothetical protein